MRPRGRVPRRAIGVRGGRVGVGGMGERGGTQRRRLYDGRLWESERPRDAMLRAAPVWPRGKLWGGRGAGAGPLCVIMCVIHGCVRCWRRRLTPDTADTRARAPARGALGSEVAYLLIYSCIVEVIVILLCAAHFAIAHWPLADWALQKHVCSRQVTACETMCETRFCYIYTARVIVDTNCCPKFRLHVTAVQGGHKTLPFFLTTQLFTCRPHSLHSAHEQATDREHPGLFCARRAGRAVVVLIWAREGKAQSSYAM